MSDENIMNIIEVRMAPAMYSLKDGLRIVGTAETIGLNRTQEGALARIGHIPQVEGLLGGKDAEIAKMFRPERKTMGTYHGKFYSMKVVELGS